MPEKKNDITLEDVLDIYINLEENIDLSNLRSVMEEDQRDIQMIITALKGYSNHEISVFEEDLYAGASGVGRNRDFYSKCLLFQSGGKNRVEVWVNKHRLPSGDMLVNDCWRRFCIVKEACQPIIRDHFMKAEWEYPDAANMMQIVTLYKNLVKFKFSMTDFDNANYPLDTKIENAAEILAILLLYPIEKMVNDRDRNNEIEYGGIFNESFYNLALGYKVPERYVELFLTSNELDRIHGLIKKKRNG